MHDNWVLHFPVSHKLYIKFMCNIYIYVCVYIYISILFYSLYIHACRLGVDHHACRLCDDHHACSLCVDHHECKRLCKHDMGIDRTCLSNRMSKLYRYVGGFELSDGPGVPSLS